MKALACGIVCAVILGCSAEPSPTALGTPSSTTSSPIPTPVAPLPSDQLAPAPPRSVQQALAGSFLKFVPLTPAQVAEVRVSANTAAHIALSEPGPGYGPAKGKVVWSKVGCIFLGWFTAEPEPRVGYVPPTYAAYLIQVLADPVPAFPMINIGVSLVDAQTGKYRGGYEGGTPPSGIVGTTCNVTP